MFCQNVCRFLLLLLGLSPLWAQTLTFDEGDFETPWTATRIGREEGTATASIQRVPTGGVVGAWASIRVQLTTSANSGYGGGYYGPATASTAWFFFTRPNMVIPSENLSRVLDLSYTEHLLHVSSSCSTCFGSMTSYVAIRQGSRTFVARRKDWLIETGWKRNENNLLRLSDFVEFGTTASSRLDTSATAPPMQLGLVRGFESGSSMEMITGLDAFSVVARLRSDLSAVDDTYTFAAGAGTTYTIGPDYGILVNDTPPGPANITVVTQPAGTLQLSPNGGFLYTPPASGDADRFQYRYTSGLGVSNVATVQIRLIRAQTGSCQLNIVMVKEYTADLKNYRHVPGGFRITQNFAGDGVAFRLTAIDIGDNPLPFQRWIVGASPGERAVIEAPYVALQEADEFVLSVPGTSISCIARNVAPAAYWSRNQYVVEDCAFMSIIEVLGRGIGINPEFVSSRANDLRQFRDQRMMPNPALRRWRDLYYRFSPEVSQIVREHPALLMAASQLLLQLGPNTQPTPELLEGAKDFARQLQPYASAELAKELGSFLTEIDSPSLRKALGVATSEEVVFASAADGRGSHFLVGSNSKDAFVRKVETATGRTVFTRWLGGGAVDVALGVAVLPNGSVAVTGFTFSTDFPLVQPLQGVHGGQTDSFVAVLDGTDGRALFSTFLGGSGFDAARGIGVDGGGNLYVAGVTGSANFPVVRPMQGILRGSEDGFVVKLNPTTRTMIWSTFFGGNRSDAIAQMHVATDGSVVVVGATNSAAQFPVSVRQERLTLAGLTDAFVAKLVPEGTAVAFSRYYGGAAADLATSVAVGADGFITMGGMRRDDQREEGWLVRYRGDGSLVQARQLVEEDAGIPIQLAETAGGLRMTGFRITDSIRFEPFLATQPLTAAQGFEVSRPLRQAVVALPSPTVLTAEEPAGATGQRVHGVLLRERNEGVVAEVGAPTTLRLRYAATRVATNSVTPGALMLLQGFQLPESVAAQAEDGAAPPNRLGGVGVRFGAETYAALHAVGAGELVLVVPAELPLGPTKAVVEFNGASVAELPVMVEAAMPQLYEVGLQVLTDEATQETRLRLYASGLGESLPESPWTFALREGNEVIKVPVATREAVGSYLGLEQLVSGPLPEAAKKLAGFTVTLEGRATSAPVNVTSAAKP